MIPINNLTNYAPILMNSTTNQLNHFQLIQEWKRWATEGETGAGEKREIAVERLQECLFNEFEKLDLTNLSLTERPPNLPPHIKILSCSGNQLSHLPENLPAGLQILNANTNQLITLPVNLPNDLKLVHVNENRLTVLPNNLPQTLKILDACNNLLAQLPENLPDSLEILDLAYNQLINLPNSLPLSLETLNVQHNLLNAIPSTLPPSLFSINALNSPIVYLPATLPRSLRIFFALGRTLVDRAGTLNLVDTVELWDKNADRDQWKRIQSEENSAAFTSFLNKLNNGFNVQNLILKEKVACWLVELIKDENSELRDKTFKLAHEACASCVDRTSFYFNKMHLLMSENEVIKTIQSRTIEEIIETALSVFRLGELEKIAENHVKKRLQNSPNFEEDIEIYLAYQYKLRDAFNLPIYTQLQFENIAGLTDKDVMGAKAQILAREKNSFLRYLVMESSIWQANIRVWNAKKQDEMKENYLKDILSDTFEAMIDEVLIREEIPVTDPDGRHRIRTRLEADRLYDEKLILTKLFLEERGALGLIAQFLNPIV